MQGLVMTETHIGVARRRPRGPGLNLKMLKK